MPKPATLLTILLAVAVGACTDRICEPLATTPFNFDGDPVASAQRVYEKTGFQMIVLTGAYDDYPLSTRHQIWLGEVLNNKRTLANETVIPIYVDDIHRDRGCDGRLPKVRAFAHRWNDAMLDLRPSAGTATDTRTPG